MYDKEKRSEQQPPQDYYQQVGAPQGYGNYYGGYPQGYYPPPQKPSTLMDFILFRRMITTVIIQFIFWMGVLAAIIIGLIALADGQPGGLFIMVFGPLVVRIYCEILIIIFRINETLTEIKNALTRR